MAVTRRAIAAATDESGWAAGPLLYARVLDWGVGIGLVTLLAAFAAAVFGWLPPVVALHRLPELWGRPAAQYLAAAGLPSGWGWVAQIGHGDVAGLAGIVVLAGTSIVALLALLPGAIARGERLFAALCLAEVAVLAFAAVGWVGRGH